MAEKIGFVGLGAMGEPMARNLLKAGFGLVVHDIDARKVQALSEAGAEVAHAPEAIARQCAHSICMVETTAQAESVIRGFAAGAAPGVRWVRNSQPRASCCSMHLFPAAPRALKPARFR